MQKIYAIVVLATHLIYNSCMAMHREPIPRVLQPLFPAQPFDNITETSSPPSYTILKPSHTQSTTNSTIPSQQNQSTLFAPFTTNPTDLLTPRYVNIAQTKRTIETQEKKPLLHTLNPIIPNQKVIVNLYDEALNITEKTLTNLIQLITHMNNAKNNHQIYEDMMAKYSYDKWVPTKTYSLAQPVLIFGYLKNYNLQVSIKKKESLPSFDDVTRKTSIKNIKNELADILGLSSTENTITTDIIYDDKTATNYPAFHMLWYSMNCIRNNTEINNFIDYIYSTHARPENEYLGLSYDNLKNKFYEICMNESIRRVPKLCDLIKIIESGKTLNPKKQEYDFGANIIASEQTPTTQFFASKMNISFTSSTRNKIGILCHCIKQYNDQRKTKRTPTPEQRNNYESRIPIFEFALPDSFDSTLFDDEKYAFKEFNVLMSKFSVLKSTSDEHIQECIKQIYVLQNK